MKKKIISLVVLIFFSIMFCGCDISVSDLNTYFGNSIQNSFEADRDALDTLSGYMKFDKGYSAELIKYRDTVDRRVTALLAAVPDDGKLKISVNVDGEQFNQDLGNAVYIDACQACSYLTAEYFSLYYWTANSIKTWLDSYNSYTNDKDRKDYYKNNFTQLNSETKLAPNEQVKQAFQILAPSKSGAGSTSGGVTSYIYIDNTWKKLHSGGAISKNVNKCWFGQMPYELRNAFNINKDGIYNGNMAQNKKTLEKIMYVMNNIQKLLNADYIIDKHSDNAGYIEYNSIKIESKVTSGNYIRGCKPNEDITITTVISYEGTDVYKMTWKLCDQARSNGILSVAKEDSNIKKTLSILVDDGSDSENGNSDYAKIEAMLRNSISGTIYTIKKEIDISWSELANKIATNNNTDNIINMYFEESNLERKYIVEKGTDSEADIDKIFNESEIELECGSVAFGYILKKGIDPNYINKITGKDGNAQTYAFSRDTSNENKVRLMLLRYPIQRIKDIEYKVSSDEYEFNTADTYMWASLSNIGSGMYKSSVDDKAYKGKMDDVYLYDKNSLEWISPSKARYGLGENSKNVEMSITPSMLENGIVKYKDSGVDATSRLLLVDYLEGLYLPGKYPNNGENMSNTDAGSIEAENVLALGRKIRIDTNIFNSNITYDTYIGKIDSSFKNNNDGIGGNINIGTLMSVARGNEKIQIADGRIGLLTGKSSITYKAKESEYADEFVKIWDGGATTSLGSQVNVGLSTSRLISQPTGHSTQPYYYVCDYAWSSDTSKNYMKLGHKFNSAVANNGSIITSITIGCGEAGTFSPMAKIYTAGINLSDIKVNGKSNVVGSEVNDNASTSVSIKYKDLSNNIGKGIRIEIIRNGAKEGDEDIVEIKFGADDEHIDSVNIHLKYGTNDHTTTINANGAPVVLASADKTSGTLGSVLGSSGTAAARERIHSNKVEIAILNTGGSTHNGMAHCEEPSNVSLMPKLYIMGRVFNVYESNFETNWLKEEIDKDSDGNLREWCKFLLKYNYKNYPVANLDDIDSVLEQIMDELDRVYDFGSLTDENSLIILDPAVIAIIQEEIDHNIIVNEAKVIRASAKILGFIIAFYGFLLMIAWLIDAGTSGEGDGVLYKITFKHMKTATGMSRKEAVELSTDGYKYVTLSSLLIRVFLLMSFGVTLLIVDPINLVSTFIGWVDGTYRMIKETLFNSKQ